MYVCMYVCIYICMYTCISVSRNLFEDDCGWGAALNILKKAPVEVGCVAGTEDGLSVELPAVTEGGDFRSTAS